MLARPAFVRAGEAAVRFFWLTRLVRMSRRRRKVGILLPLAMVATSVAGNTLTFIFFERLGGRDVTVFDGFWYSFVSITTIGYGDFSAVSLGARLGTIFFIMLTGLVTLTATASMIIDWIQDLHYKERSGMGSVEARNHLLIINFPNEPRVRQIAEEFRYDPQHRRDDIVIVTDQIASLPLTLPDVLFVRGSPLEEDTYRRARVSQARQAIVLATGYDDPSSDSVVASAAAIVGHLNPEIRIVAECLSEEHSVLFARPNHVPLVHTLRLANNLLVQEAQDPGVNLLTQVITSNQIEGTLASTKIADAGDGALGYLDVAKKLLDKDINLIGLIRDGSVHLNFGNLTLTRNDALLYISTSRHTWESLRSLLN